MDIFFILQILFDAVLLFGVIFLFHYSISQAQKKKDDLEVLENIQVQEMKENVQELMSTLEKMAKKIAEDIHGQIGEAEGKSEKFKKDFKNMQAELSRALTAIQRIDSGKKTLLEEDKSVKRSRAGSRKEESIKKAFAGRKSKDSNNKMFKNVGVPSETIEEIYRLADENRDLNEIARFLKIGKAEVQLILNLRSNRFSTSN